MSLRSITNFVQILINFNYIKFNVRGKNYFITTKFILRTSLCVKIVYGNLIFIFDLFD